MTRPRDQDDARIVWLRANRTPWKKIGWEIGLSRPAANRHWEYGIAVITWRLNGRVPPAKRSKRFVVERARSLVSQGLDRTTASTVERKNGGPA